MGKTVICLVVSDRHNIRCEKVHDLYSRQTLELTVDQRASEHVAGDGIDDIFFLIAYLVDIAGKTRNSTYELVVYLLRKEVSVKVVRVQERQFFQILHIYISP